MKTAIVHDYFYQNGGAEKTVEAILEAFPDSDLFTSLYYSKNFQECHWLTKLFHEGRIKTSFMQWFMANKWGIRFFKHFFWLYPLAMRTLVVKDYDLVVISSSYPAKNVTIKNAKKIISYCHSPSRFLHNMARETDMKSVNPVLRFLVPLFTWWLKDLDIASAKRLEKQGAIWFVNAKHMVNVVRDAYGVESTVLYPPVDTAHFLELNKKIDTKEPYYYYFGRISFHKKIDILIKACAQAGKRFYLCGGSGLDADKENLQSLINDLDIEFPGTKEKIKLLGRLPDKERDEYLQGAKGFLFAGKEDFGIAPIEALASGTPIIMYQAGGALDYLIDRVNGIFSSEQTPESFAQAIKEFETITFDESVVRNSTDKFDKEHYINDLHEVAAHG